MSNNQTTVDIQTELKQLGDAAVSQLETASDKESLEAVKVEFLGRNGKITGILRGLKDVPKEDRGAVGSLANQIQQDVQAKLDEKFSALEAKEIEARISEESIDVTMPGIIRPVGSAHPLTQVTKQISDIFKSMGFEVIDDNTCPEIETEYYNFEALNFPENHPARDMQDTYYTDVAKNVLLRSQTSNAQIRYMERGGAAKLARGEQIRVVSPGRVYRNEDVSSRKHVLFHQLEGLLVAEDVTFADLKGTLSEFTRRFFADGSDEQERPTRFRASYFPFTEPSAEVDVQCIFCKGDGCQVCSQLGWLEILGAGMVDPNVLEEVGIDSEKYVGYAFGMGIERLTMLKYTVNDIRNFFNGDLRFLKQF